MFDDCVKNKRKWTIIALLIGLYYYCYDSKCTFYVWNKIFCTHNFCVSYIINVSNLICVIQGAKIMTASHFDYEYVLGHKIAFLCVARGSPRPHITWYKDGGEIFQHLYMHVSFTRMTNVLILILLVQIVQKAIHQRESI